MPFVAAARGASTEAVGEFPAEFQAPLSAVDLLRSSTVADRDAARRQHLLDHAQAQRESEIEPHRVGDELCREAIAGINRVSRRRHPRTDIRPPPDPPIGEALNLTVPPQLLSIGTV